LTHVFRASPACLSFFPMRCSKASIGGFFHLLSCPRSIFLDDPFSSIFSSNDLFSLTSLLLFFFFDQFDLILVNVSSAQFALHLFFSFFFTFFLNPYPRDNMPPTLTCESSRGIVYLNLLFYFDFRLCSAAYAFFSIPPHCVQTVFSVFGTQFQLHLVPRPFSFFFY
jgi:hypothetical protein